ncbi:MAG: hypothetical protein ACLGGX_02855 [Bdellovibrionia bacterium]
MQKGYNSDLNIRGKSYHIQTEDWGQNNPFIVSRIFCNGAVLKTIKTPYEIVLKTGKIYTDEAIKEGLKIQHNRIIDILVEGGAI